VGLVAIRSMESVGFRLCDEEDAIGSGRLR